MENTLMCNFKNCRKPLKSQAWVTSCSHVFCNEDAEREFAKGLICPACETPLPGKFDAIRHDLNPSEQYRSMVLAGQRPEVCLDICSRAINFWTYQVQQEIVYQQYITDKAKEKKDQLERFCDDLAQKASAQVEQMKSQLNATKKALESSHKRESDLMERLAEKNRQYVRLQNIYETLRRKIISPAIFEKRNTKKSRETDDSATFGMAFANEIIFSQRREKTPDTGFQKPTTSNDDGYRDDFVLRPIRTPLAGDLRTFSRSSTNAPTNAKN